MPKIMISAAEVSGDVHGSYLVKEIKKIDPSITFFGIGGERLKAEGVDIRQDITSKSTIGIFEALKHIPSHLKTVSNLKKIMDQEKPDALILVDAQGFNMVMAGIAKSKGIKTIYYIAPQEWLWGTDKGVKKVVNTIDLIVSIFKKEHEVYSSAGGKSIYYGHPLVDLAKKSLDRDKFISKYNLNKTNKIISLCPGSRRQEIKKLLPILINTAKKIKRALPDVQFVLPLSSSVFKNRINKIISRSGIDIIVIEGDSYNVMGNSDLVIAVSGTIVLESAILGTPVIMFYKLSLLTYFLAKYILKVKLPYYSMPNIIENKLIVPEYVMGEANPKNLYNESLSLLENDRKIRKMKNDFDELSSKLGNPNVISKTAGSIVDFLKNT